MKNTAAVIAFVALTTSAFAGGLHDAEMEGELMVPMAPSETMTKATVVEQAGSSSAPSGTMVMVLSVLAAFGAAFAN